jgi:hypothetical protein
MRILIEREREREREREWERESEREREREREGRCCLLAFVKWIKKVLAHTYRERECLLNG